MWQSPADSAVRAAAHRRGGARHGPAGVAAARRRHGGAAAGAPGDGHRVLMDIGDLGWPAALEMAQLRTHEFACGLGLAAAFYFVR